MNIPLSVDDLAFTNTNHRSSSKIAIPTAAVDLDSFASPIRERLMKPLPR